MSDDSDVLDLLKGDAKIVQEAKQRFGRCKEFEQTSQARFQEDLKFANADPDNGWQWPNYLWAQRQDDPAGYKPRLTVNKTRQHNLQIINDAKQNKPGIKITPVGGDATFKAAQLWQGLIRHIERTSKASQAYDTATKFQVEGGIGYIRVTTDYVEDDSFDQEIYIRRVKNPLNVYLDPDCNEADKSDARFGFVFDDIPKDEFYREYPEMKDRVSQAPLNDSGGWIDKDHVRVAEYFARTMKKDKLVLMRNPGDNKMIVARWSKIPSDIRKQIEPDMIEREREILDHKINWYKIAAEEIVERGVWPGRYIPIVPVIGEETIIEGRLDRKGHTRNLKDAQRMYNYWTSSAVEQVALQTKTKWFVPVGATTNLETYYATMNRQNYPFIPYNAMDDEGNPLPAPIPIEPPMMADAFIKGMQVSQSELMMASGQYQSQMGQQGNEVSGKAIAERQRQGDNATYHYIDGLAMAIRQIGNIILDIAPYIYDTKQIKRILAEDGTEQMVQIDPNATAAYSEQKGEEENSIIAVFNPKVGRYWVDSDVGPSFATKRQEAWNAFVQITAQNKELVNSIGDLMFRNADFPGADEIAERLHRLVPPAVLGEGPDQALQEAQQINQNLQKLIAELTDELAKKNLELKDKSGKLAIEEQDAQTRRDVADSRRLKEAGNSIADLGADVLKPVVEKLLREILGEKAPIEVQLPAPESDEDAGETAPDTDIAEGGAQPSGGASEPPVEGAKQAPDGQWYVPDASRPGKFIQVQAGAA